MLDRFIDHSIPKAVRTVLWIITALYFLMWAVGQEFSALSWVLLTVSIAIRVPYWQAERKRKEEVLFPIRLDDAVMETGEAWAAKLRARLIRDFRRWQEHAAYQTSFQRMLRDLTKEQPTASTRP